MQMRSVFLVFKVMFVTSVALVASKGSPCWTYTLNWMGMLPMEIVGAALAWELCWLYMPKDPDHDPVLQASLHCYCCCRPCGT